MTFSSKTEEFLGIAPGDVVAFVGGGGKSTLMHSLARRLAADGRRVITAATRPFRPDPGESPYLFLTDERPLGEILPNLAEHGAVTVSPGRLPDGTLAGYLPEEVDTFSDLGDYLFVEAEDSGGKSLPPPPPRPRPIPAVTTVLAVVAGLDALGPDLLTEAFAERLLAEGGPLRCRPGIERRALLLNKADRNSIRQDGARVAGQVRAKWPEGRPPPKILLTSVRDFLRKVE